MLTKVRPAFGVLEFMLPRMKVATRPLLCPSEIRLLRFFSDKRTVPHATRDVPAAALPEFLHTGNRECAGSIIRCFAHVKDRHLIDPKLDRQPLVYVCSQVTARISTKERRIVLLHPVHAPRA